MAIKYEVNPDGTASMWSGAQDKLELTDLQDKQRALLTQIDRLQSIRDLKRPQLQMAVQLMQQAQQSMQAGALKDWAAFIDNKIAETQADLDALAPVLEALKEPK